MKYSIIQESGNEPLDLAFVKSYLRVDGSDDDDTIDLAIKAAREMCEEKTKRSIKTRTYELVLNDFPDQSYIEVPRPPFISIESIKYRDKNGDSYTVDPSEYEADIESEPGNIVTLSIWPQFTPYPVNAVRIRYSAGYGIDKVPSGIKQAMLLLISHWYENRRVVSVGEVTKVIEFTVDALLSSYIIYYV